MVYTFIFAFIYSGFLLYNVIIISNEVKKIALLKNNTTMGKIENMTLFQINKSYDFFIMSIFLMIYIIIITMTLNYLFLYS